MLMRFLTLWVAVLSIGGFVHAEPFVPGFDRFKDQRGNDIDLGNILLS